MQSPIHKRRAFFIAIGLIAAVGLTGLFFPKRQQSEEIFFPRAVVETIVKIPTLPKLRDRKTGRTGYIDMYGWLKLRPSAIDSTGNIDLISDQGDLLSYSATGKLQRRVSCSWLHHATLLQRSPSGEFWVMDVVETKPHRFFWRMVKTDKKGQPLWQMGRTAVMNYKNGKSVRDWQRPPAQMDEKNPQIPYRSSANPQDSTADQFDDIEGLSTTRKGDVFVLENSAEMRRYNGNGNLVERYSLKKEGSQPDDFVALRSQSGFSAVVASDGTIYCHPFVLRGEGAYVTHLPIDHWTSPTKYVTRLVDVSPLRKIPYKGVRLMDVDSSDNLYLEYLGGEVEVGNWEPQAIAMVGKDGKAISLFDIEKQYGEEIRQAKARWTRNVRESSIGVGDLLRVSNKGELYLEISTDTHYRIDKISFPDGHRPPQPLANR